MGKSLLLYQRLKPLLTKPTQGDQFTFQFQIVHIPIQEEEKLVSLKTAVASVADIDDRRSVFQVTSSNSKK